MKDGRKRSFSLANAPHDDAVLQLHIRHVPGGAFTEQVFSTMKLRDILRFNGPHGSFYLREDSAKPVILLAGGTGFAPIKAIVEHAIAENCQRPLHIYWGAKARVDLYQHALPERWAAEHAHISYVPVLSNRRPTTAGPVAPASCTTPCWPTSRTCPATRFTPAARHDDRQREARPGRALRPAGRGILRRRLHVRGELTGRRPIRRDRPPAPWDRRAVRRHRRTA
jgi:ferredoxin-NADP reductase